MSETREQFRERLFNLHNSRWDRSWHERDKGDVNLLIEVRNDALEAVYAQALRDVLTHLADEGVHMNALDQLVEHFVTERGIDLTETPS